MTHLAKQAQGKKEKEDEGKIAIYQKRDENRTENENCKDFNRKSVTDVVYFGKRGISSDLCIYRITSQRAIKQSNKQTK